jgi:Protein of unknown function (DUF3455)
VRRLLVLLAAMSAASSLVVAGAAAAPRTSSAGVAPAGAPAGASASSVSGGVPPELRVPAGQRPVLISLGRGVQIYDCVGGAWTFREPAAAILLGSATVALHFAGPTWQSHRDGSKVTAAVRARVNAPRAERDIPWLLLEATGNAGAGQFGEVDYVQRLRTEGGVAPAGACDAATRPTAAVPYTAVYVFWAPRPA